MGTHMSFEFKPFKTFQSFKARRRLSVQIVQRRELYYWTESNM